MDALGVAFSRLMLKLALPSAAAAFAFLIAVLSAGTAAHGSRRIRRAAEGVVSLLLLSAWFAAMAVAGSFPTREEKERMRAAQARIENVRENTRSGEPTTNGAPAFAFNVGISLDGATSDFSFDCVAPMILRGGIHVQ